MSTKPISEMRFSEHVEKMLNGDNEYIRTGYDWQGQNPGWTMFFQAGELFPFVLSNYYKSETAYTWETEWIEVFSFPNDYKIKMRFYVDPNIDVRYYTYFAEYRMFDDNDNIVSPSGSDIGGSVNMMISYKDNLYNDLIIYVAPSTRYPQGNPTPNDAPSDFRFWFFVGHMDDGYMLSSNSLIYPLAVSGYLHRGVIGWISDLQAFSDYMSTHGKTYSDDLFSDEPIPEGPAGSDDTSEPGGGGGNYDDTSDPIDFPALPQGGALESGSIIAHRVVKQTLEAIFSKLWTKSIFDLDAMWQKSIENPMDAIVSLHALPCSPQVVADPNNIYIGNLDMEVTSPKLTSQYIEVDCGIVTLQEFWGSALDYSPYTRVEIYLPFIGVQTLRTEDVMKTNVHVKYHVDALTGDCIAFIKCGMSVLYTFNGNCKMNIPLSARSTDFLQKVAAAAGLAIGAVGVSVGGGAALAGATKAPQIASATVTATAADIQAGSMAVSSAANIASTKINTSRSGDISGGLSLMASFVPYFIIHRPVQSLAKDFNKFKGYTSNITKRLGDLTGFTEVEHVNLQGIPNATAAEMAEIKTALKNGVIF